MNLINLYSGSEKTFSFWYLALSLFHFEYLIGDYLQKHLQKEIAHLNKQLILEHTQNVFR